MAQCPVCQTENDGDFGLVNCKSCGSPFFVEIDGSASAAAAPPPVTEAPPMVPDAPEPPPPTAFEAAVIKEVTAIQEVPETLEMPEAPPTPIEDLRQIADYGNSDVSLAREGAYRFTLHIGGIDTAEIRQEVRDNLADARFLWDIDALLATIKDGELTLTDVSAVKAALAIQRLKLLPVDLKWEQHAIHQNHS